MLSRSDYTPDYIDQCRKKVSNQLAAYHYLKSTAKKQTDSELDSALEANETQFFNHMVLALD